jgi:isopropylmalate/homocitrate/citramalate synthase
LVNLHHVTFQNDELLRKKKINKLEIESKNTNINTIFKSVNEEEEEGEEENISKEELEKELSENKDL